MHIPGSKQPSIAVRCSPLKYNTTRIHNLPYTLIYAIASKDAVLIYATHSSKPLYAFIDFHYATITDLAWDKSGMKLFFTSSDGFLTIVQFEEKELGGVLKPDSKIESKLDLCDIREKNDIDIDSVFEKAEPLITGINLVAVKRKNVSTQEKVKKTKEADTEVVVVVVENGSIEHHSSLI